MKKTILTLLLAAMSTGAMAEWVKIDGADKYELYVDPSSIRKNGKLVKMWNLKDYKQPEMILSSAISSVRTQNEYDCSGERYRMLAGLMNSGNMGKGEIVFSDNVRSDWGPVVPNSVGATMWKIACGKTKLK